MGSIMTQTQWEKNICVSLKWGLTAVSAPSEHTAHLQDGAEEAVKTNWVAWNTECESTGPEWGYEDWDIAQW